MFYDTTQYHNIPTPDLVALLSFMNVMYMEQPKINQSQRSHLQFMKTTVDKLNGKIANLRRSIIKNRFRLDPGDIITGSMIDATLSKYSVISVIDVVKDDTVITNNTIIPSMVGGKVSYDYVEEYCETDNVFWFDGVLSLEQQEFNNAVEAKITLLQNSIAEFNSAIGELLPLTIAQYNRAKNEERQQCAKVIKQILISRGYFN